MQSYIVWIFSFLQELMQVLCSRPSPPLSESYLGTTVLIPELPASDLVSPIVRLVIEQQGAVISRSESFLSCGKFGAVRLSSDYGPNSLACVAFLASLVADSSEYTSLCYV